MRQLLEELAGNNQFYHARREEYETTNTLPFLVSPEPLTVSAEEAREIGRIGIDVVDFIAATDELYAINEDVHELLSRGKPDFFQDQEVGGNYLFLRPDLIITPGGFTICEIETSPFGLALAELLNSGYTHAGFETIVGADELQDYVSAVTPTEGAIVHTNKTSSYAGQLAFLADKVFSNGTRNWQSQHIDEIGDVGDSVTNIYRAHYLSEYVSDPKVKQLLESAVTTDSSVFPSLTPHLEEKAVMAFIWDKRFEGHYVQQLGQAAFEHLREVIPPTWIVGEEQYFAPGLPEGTQSSLDLANLPKSRRAFVLKSSGFSSDSSWSEGVSLLHKKSGKQAQELIQQATSDQEHLYIMQYFQRGQQRPMSYQTEDGTETMQARIRLTPYFSTRSGNLISVKATGCENTDLIHASTASINTAVRVG